MTYFYQFLSILTINTSQFFFIQTFLQKKKLKVFPIILFLFTTTILTFVIRIVLDKNMLGLSFYILLLIFFARYYFSITYNQSAIAVFFSQCCFALSETWIVTTCYIFFPTLNFLEASILGFFLTILISSIALLLLKFRFCKTVFIWSEKSSEFHSIFLFGFFVFFISLLIATSNKLEPITWFITPLFFIFLFVFFISYIKKMNLERKLEQELDSLMEYTQLYEKTLDHNRKVIHEYKNQLIVIRSLIDSRNKKAYNYINQLLQSEEDYDERLRFKLSVLPISEIRALFLYKISLAEKTGIEVELDIDPQIIHIDPSTMEQNIMDISRILGVFLDNALDAVESLKQKKLFISIFRDLENQFCITISNPFQGFFPLEKIYRDGYSTKGKGRGYGLGLVKDILIKNPTIKNQTEVTGNIFTQIIIVSLDEKKD